MSDFPKVTIGVIGCNRLHYFRALIESARACIDYPNLEWVVIDNASVEEGMRDYLATLDFVDHLIVREKRNPAHEHIEAMNTLLEVSSASYMAIIPDDIQFILKGKWLVDVVELMRDNQQVGSITLDAQRNVTVAEVFGRKKPLLRRAPRRSHYRTTSGREFLGYGDSKVGIQPAGITSLTRKEVWDHLGPWKVTGGQTQGDSTGGGEDDMHIRFHKMGLKMERILPRIPMAARIVTPPGNTTAYVRGNRRFSRYMPPNEGSFYYQLRTEKDLLPYLERVPSVGIDDFAVPIGFDFAYDSKGHFIKPGKAQNDPFEWIHPSVKGVEI
ncbi:MAG: glycosyltransferase family 2 protein [Chloroflexi bacterium]|nr:glycosyltransferase family 2 protein [Chloroflexota bacterium]